MKFWIRIVCLVACGVAATARGVGAVEVARADGKGGGFATFQSRNQKVVSNANGIFLTYLHEDNEKAPARPNVWRLMRSVDGGKTFSVVYEGRNGCPAPCIETDGDGNLYLAHQARSSADKPKQELHFYRFAAAKKYKAPKLSVFPGVRCAANFSMAHDAKRKQFYIATQYGQLLTVSEDGKLLAKRAAPKSSSPKARAQHPLLQVDRDGRIIGSFTQDDRVKFFGIASEPKSKDSHAKALLKTRNKFYTQHRISGGVLILGSEKVSKYAMGEVAYLLKNMLANRPDVLEHLARTNRYVGIQAYTEMTSDLPEQSGLDVWWDYRARGLCGALVTCGEENVMMYPGDPWAGENIFIHEFGHQIMHSLKQIDKGFMKRLCEVYVEAQKSKRFRGYGLNDDPHAPLEFWAESVQAYYNCNGAIRPEAAGSNPSLEALDADGKHLCHIRTRAQLKKYLPGMAELVDKSFGRNKWTYTPVTQRLAQPHLRGYDPSKAPTFAWPKHVIEGFHRVVAERKAAKAKQKK